MKRGWRRDHRRAARPKPPFSAVRPAAWAGPTSGQHGRHADQRHRRPAPGSWRRTGRGGHRSMVQVTSCGPSTPATDARPPSPWTARRAPLRRRHAVGGGEAERQHPPRHRPRRSNVAMQNSGNEPSRIAAAAEQARPARRAAGADQGRRRDGRGAVPRPPPAACTAAMPTTKDRRSASWPAPGRVPCMAADHRARWHRPTVGVCPRPAPAPPPAATTLPSCENVAPPGPPPLFCRDRRGSRRRCHNRGPGYAALTPAKGMLRPKRVQGPSSHAHSTGVSS